jgi:3-isopropylmalate/(R)-2-methylmalate dehydratase small subunit
MQKFTVLEGLVAPLDRANVDTDQIIPQKYLQSIRRTGFGEACFASWRKDPEFVLNQSRYKDAQILLARKNFGVGSSREHAPWALRDYGFRAVIAPSFGEIFQSNSLKNGFLPIALSESEVDKLFYDAASFAGFKLRIDLEQQTVSTLDSAKTFRFDRAFEARRKQQFPWYF